MKKILILLVASCLLSGMSGTVLAGGTEEQVLKSRTAVVKTQQSLLGLELGLIQADIGLKERNKIKIGAEIDTLSSRVDVIETEKGLKDAKLGLETLRTKLENLEAQYNQVDEDLRELRRKERQYLAKLSQLEEELSAMKIQDWLEETGSGFGLGLGVVDGKFVCDIRGKIEKLVIYYEIDGQKDEKTTSYWIGATYPIWKFLNVSFLVGLQTGNFQNYNPTVGIAYHAGKFFLEGRYGFQIGLHPESWGVAGGIYF